MYQQYHVSYLRLHLNTAWLVFIVSCTSGVWVQRELLQLI